MTVHAEGLVVLMAEDDEGHFELIRDNLRECGLTCPLLRFVDGQQAADYLLGGEELSESGRYVLMTDIRMPRMNGLELIRRVRADARFAAMPILVLTTTDDPAEIGACYEAGCNAYFVKPTEFGEFEQVMRLVTTLLGYMRVPLLKP